MKKIFKVDILSTWCDAHILIKPRKGNGFRNSRFKTQSKEFRELSSKGGVKKNADLNSSSLMKDGVTPTGVTALADGVDIDVIER